MVLQATALRRSCCILHVRDAPCLSTGVGRQCAHDGLHASIVDQAPQAPRLGSLDWIRLWLGYRASRFCYRVHIESPSVELGHFVLRSPPSRALVDYRLLLLLWVSVLYPVFSAAAVPFCTRWCNGLRHRAIWVRCYLLDSFPTICLIMIVPPSNRASLDAGSPFRCMSSVVGPARVSACR
jgi:hypothetical protein